MLSFAVFDDAGPATAGTGGLAHLFGAGEMPLQGAVRFEGGRLICEKLVPETAGLVIQFPVEAPSLVGPGGLNGSGDAPGSHASPGGAGSPALGLLALRTCLLPDRDEPYMLTLELARHRIMHFLNKLEDWGLFDLPADSPVLTEFELARRTFTAALVEQRHDVQMGAGGKAGSENGWGFSAKADRLARAALAQAVDAGEKLALVNAERQLPARLSGQMYSSAAARVAAITQERPAPGAPAIVPGVGQAVVAGAPQIGCVISPDQYSEPLQKAAGAACDFVTMPMRWVDMEPGEGKYDFTPTDRWIEWAVRQAKVSVVGGPLVDLRPSCTPEWLYIWENDYETLRELVYDHVQQIVTRYRRTVTRWTICSGLHVNTNFKLSFEQIMDLTRLCVLVVKKLHPSAKVQLEIAEPWGEYHAENKRSLPPRMYAEAVAQAGLGIDALGIRLQMGQPASGQATRDLMALSAILDAYGDFEKPIAITAAGVPSVSAPPAGGRDGGLWRSPWSEQGQADWLTKVMLICLSKPYVQSVCWQDLSDASAKVEMPGGGLVGPGGAPKPAMKRMAQIRAALREGRSFAPLLGSPQA